MTTRPWRASSWSDPAPARIAASRERLRAGPEARRRVRRHRLPRLRRAAGPAHRRRRAAARHSPARAAHAGGSSPCAGRTDAGVHAWGQVVSGALPDGVDVDVAQVAHAVNGQLGPEIVVRSAEIVDGDFDARHSAHWREYRYTIVNRDAPDPFLARYRVVGAHPARPVVAAPGCRSVRRRARLRVVLPQRPCGIDDDAAGARVALGRHRRRCAPLRDPRQLRSAGRWCARSSARWSTSASASSRPGDVLRILRARDRAAAGRVAPPEGLCLWEVGY